MFGLFKKKDQEDEKVMSVNYSGKTGGWLWTHAKCGELVERCY